MKNLYLKIEQVIAYIEAHAAEQPDLERLAAQAGLSVFHFQRVFKRLVGVSPKRFLQFCTLEAAKQQLTQDANLLDVSFAVGLSGPGRLHDLFINGEAVTPGVFKAGGETTLIDYGIHETPFGWALVAMTEHGICELDFCSSDAPLHTMTESLKLKWPKAQTRENPARTAEVIEAMLLEGQGAVTRLPLHIRGTNFQLKVWQALLRVPEGALTDYSAIARAIGHATATRAVGSAVGDNPIAFLIPCHRVLRKDGGIGGYATGTPRKRAMLAYEALAPR